MTYHCPGPPSLFAQAAPHWHALTYGWIYFPRGSLGVVTAAAEVGTGSALVEVTCASILGTTCAWVWAKTSPLCRSCESVLEWPSWWTWCLIWNSRRTHLCGTLQACSCQVPQGLHPLNAWVCPLRLFRRLQLGDWAWAQSLAEVAVRLREVPSPADLGKATKQRMIPSALSQNQRFGATELTIIDRDNLLQILRLWAFICSTLSGFSQGITHLDGAVFCCDVFCSDWFQ